jgi:hypothetical protein
MLVLEIRLDRAINDLNSSIYESRTVAGLRSEREAQYGSLDCNMSDLSGRILTLKGRNEVMY